MGAEEREEVETLGRAMTAAAHAGGSTTTKRAPPQRMLEPESTMLEPRTTTTVRSIPAHLQRTDLENKTVTRARRERDMGRADLLKAATASAKDEFFPILQDIMPNALLDNVHVGPTSGNPPLTPISFCPPATNLALNMVAANPKHHIKEHQSRLKGLKDGFIDLHNHIHAEHIHGNKSSSQLCRAAGLCVHQGEGIHIRRVRDSLVRTLAAIFPRHVLGRKQLLNAGKIVISISYPHDTSHPPSTQWHHIGEIYWNPIRPTLHPLHYVTYHDAIGEYQLKVR